MDRSDQAELAAKGSGWSIACPAPTASVVWAVEILALDIPDTPGIDGEASRGLQAARIAARPNMTIFRRIL